jgi:hypothetical protein
LPAYRSDVCAVFKRDENRFTAAVMKFMAAVGCTRLDRKKNLYIKGGINMQAIMKFMENYIASWKNSVLGTPR